MSFDPHFRFYREDPQDRAGGLATFAELAAEFVEELADRRRLYPSLVAKGRMTEDAAKREIRTIAALLWLHTFPVDSRPAERPEATWTDMIHTLRREIALRRKFYPDWIVAGRIVAATAWRKLELLENIHENLWFGCGHAEAIAARGATEDRRRAHPDRRAA